MYESIYNAPLLQPKQSRVPLQQPRLISEINEYRPSMRVEEGNLSRTLVLNCGHDTAQEE